MLLNETLHISYDRWSSEGIVALIQRKYVNEKCIFLEQANRYNNYLIVLQETTTFIKITILLKSILFKSQVSKFCT